MAKQRTVFFSYNRRDASIAEKIAREFKRSGVQLYDPSKELVAGDNFRETIRRAAKSSVALVLVVASPDYAASAWSGYEAGLFDATGKPVIVLASRVFPISSLPVDLMTNRVYTFDPSMPELAARLAANDLLAAA